MFNPTFQVTSELMFEQYSVPMLAFCVDSVMSFYQNNLPSKPNVPFAQDGLVILFNMVSTSVIPILSGRGTFACISAGVIGLCAGTASEVGLLDFCSPVLMCLCTSILA